MITRKIFDKLKEEGKDKKISILLGARQVGKTTLLKALFSEFSKTNKCLFLDLDILSNYEKISTFESLITTLKLNGYEEKQKEFFYLFLDEFQRYPNAAKLMKNVYDNLDNIKIYASGSSSLKIKNSIQESLAGRKKINQIFPLDFEEFLLFKDKKELINKFAKIKSLSGDRLSDSLKEFYELLEEFLIFGGYPEVALKKTKEEKINTLESIFDLYVKKDLVEYLKIDKILAVKKLLEALAINNGKKIKYEYISQITSLKFNDIKKHLEILKETYLIEIVKPFSTSKNKELVKIPKIYFIDNGVRNYFIKNFNVIKIRDDAGHLFEGFLISELLKKGKSDLKFWQDKNGNEVDILIDKISEQIPIEAKFKNNLKSEDFIGLNAFLNEYPKTKKKYLVNLSIQKLSKGINLILPFSLGKI